MIELKNLRSKIAAFLLGQIDLVVPKGAYAVILGPTGAGKTILLETIAGLHTLNQGQIILDGKDVTTTVPEARGVSIVYQDYALFPHLTVKENIVFGLRVRHAQSRRLTKRWCG